jgi:hypothetical protein
MLKSLSPGWRQFLGWTAISISTLTAGFWAVWGSIENFHEGWYFTSTLTNIELLLGQYLSPMLIVMLISIVALRWPGAALPVLGCLALAAAIFLHGGPAAVHLISMPLLALAGLYFLGNPRPRRWAYRCLIGLPLLTALISGAYPGWRAIHRLDDGNYGTRLVQGNGVTLVWAPQGPGWPSHYASWHRAERNCALLSADGLSLASTTQAVWRLPTIDEAVRSLVYRGHNAGGVWNPVNQRATYRVMPDKDSPLWNPHSQVIYWWTGTEAGDGRVYRIAYNGYVLAWDKRGWGDYWAYRCVREPEGQDPFKGPASQDGKLQ